MTVTLPQGCKRPGFTTLCLLPQADLERLAEELTAAQDARQSVTAQQERLSKALHAAKQQVTLAPPC
jgi:hypothetical protein